MNKFLIFIVRAIFSGVFAVVISKVFKPEATPLFIGGLAVFLLGASYSLAFFRKQKTDN